MTSNPGTPCRIIGFTDSVCYRISLGTAIITAMYRTPGGDVCRAIAGDSLIMGWSGPIGNARVEEIRKEASCPNREHWKGKELQRIMLRDDPEYRYSPRMGTKCLRADPFVICFAGETGVQRNFEGWLNIR